MAILNCVTCDSGVNGSFHAGFSLPTLEGSDVLTSYFCGASVSYWFTPLSFASTASMNVLYIFKKIFSTRSSPCFHPNTFATISRPKCLYTKPADESLVVNPNPKTSVKPFWWWSNLFFERSYVAPTSMTTSQVANTSGSRERTISPPEYALVCWSRKHPKASSQWKEPSCVPIVVGAIRFVPDMQRVAVRGEYALALKRKRAGW
mmetsp:Transcript_7778/g.29116  ORF Transcript_7778/g.29116 Transcript_7778/m.29116 type:complete len:205 (+) Transcript_7778:815-1429(+)